jgi:hypothetical protein
MKVHSTFYVSLLESYISRADEDLVDRSITIKIESDDKE